MNDEQDTQPISVYLRPGRLRLLFCMICRENLHMQLEGFPKLVVPGDASILTLEDYRALKYPIKIRCSGKSQRYGRCPALWVIQGFIDE